MSLPLSTLADIPLGAGTKAVEWLLEEDFDDLNLKQPFAIVRPLSGP